MSQKKLNIVISLANPPSLLDYYEMVLLPASTHNSSIDGIHLVLHSGICMGLHFGNDTCQMGA